MAKSLQGKKALITGASSGIGRAIAFLFAQEGADLCLVSRRQKELSTIAEQCRSFGVKAAHVVADITQKAHVERMARESLSALDQINILINNAGYGKYGAFTELAIEEWDRMWRVNVRAMVLVTRAIVPSMAARRQGHIVNISSMLGIDAAANASAYCTTKFAVSGLTEALSKELWKDEIKVSLVCPGGVLTPFSGIPPEQKNQEFMEPEEVARVVLDVVTAPGKALVMKVVIAPRTRPFFVQEVSLPAAKDRIGRPKA